MSNEQQKVWVLMYHDVDQSSQIMSIHRTQEGAERNRNNWLNKKDDTQWTYWNPENLEIHCEDLED